jgi:hypothetical protein
MTGSFADYRGSRLCYVKAGLCRRATKVANIRCPSERNEYCDG